MNCERCADLWPDAIAGTLPPDVTAAAHRHADGCAACRRDRAAWLALAAAARDRLSPAAAAPPPAAFALAKVLDRNADRSGPPVASDARPGRKAATMRTAAFAAAVAVAALGGWFGRSAWQRGDVPLRREASTAPEHDGQWLTRTDARGTEAAAVPGSDRGTDDPSARIDAAPPPTVVSRKRATPGADVRLVAGPTAARRRPNGDTAGIALATAPAFEAIPLGRATPSREAPGAAAPSDRVDPPTPTAVLRPPDRPRQVQPPPTPPAFRPSLPSPTPLPPPPPAVLVLLGQVRTADGRPVAEARVFIVPWPDDGRLQVAGTASDGTFDAPVAPGRYRLRVVADGFPERWYGDDAGGPRTIDVSATEPVPTIVIVLPAIAPPIGPTAVPSPTATES